MSIRLLTPPHNFAICKMDERNYPGVVVQGDTLFSLSGLLSRAVAEMKNDGKDADDDSVIHELEYQVGVLKTALKSYEETCAKNGFGLPFPKPE